MRLSQTNSHPLISTSQLLKRLSCLSLLVFVFGLGNVGCSHMKHSDGCACSKAEKCSKCEKDDKAKSDCDGKCH